MRQAMDKILRGQWGIILLVYYQDMFEYKRVYKSNNDGNVRLCQVEQHMSGRLNGSP